MKMILRCIMISLAAFGAATTQAADKYVVGGGTGDGSTWVNAAGNIQTAVDAATAGDTVWVRAGTYTSTAANVVSINKSLTLRNDTDVPADAIIIDGGGVRRGIYVNLTAAGSVVKLDGLTITNGYVSSVGGGGIYILHSTIATGTALVQRCVIAGNFATNCYAGGIYTYGKNDQTAFNTILSDCRIVGNVRRSNSTNNGLGGGVAAYRALLTMEDCDVSDNADHGGSNHFNAGGVGGGIYIREGALGSEIRNCHIERNLTENSFNVTVAAGGGIGRNSADTNLLSIQDCVIQSNTSHNGGGITGPALFLKNCTIQYNLGGQGGGLQTVGDVDARNCLITHNETTVGAGGWYHSKNPSVLRIDNCTISSNKTTATSNPVGGIVTLPGTTHIIRNSIIYDNESTWTMNMKNFYLQGSGTVSNSCSFPLIADGGNISSDPKFVSMANADFHLQSDSPCINTGTNQLWMASALDLDGKKRLDWKSGLVDMGCYEFSPPFPLGTAIIIR